MALGDIHWVWSLFLERTTAASQDPKSSGTLNFSEHRPPSAFLVHSFSELQTQKSHLNLLCCSMTTFLGLW